MTAIRRISRRLANLVMRRRQDDRLRSEIETHIALQAEDNVRAGMPPDIARREARLKFGAVESTRDAYRDQESIPILENLLRDARHGLRMLRRSPGFTIAAALTLAVGIGATTAMFSIVDGVLLEPLAYPDAGQLMAVQLFVPAVAQTFPMVPVNPAAYLGWADHAKSLSGIGLVEDGVRLDLTSGGEPEMLTGDAVTSDVFDVLGVKLLLGRNFLPETNQAGHNHEVILTHALWMTRFHGAPDIVGRAITLDGRAYTVVGVLPRDCYFPSGNQLGPMGSDAEPQMFVPEVLDRGDLAPDAGFGYGAIARVKPGVSREQATAEMNVILSRTLGPQSFMPDPRTVLVPLGEMIVRSTKRALWMLFAAIAAVLLIICVNLANLVLTRATAHEQQSAIRRALGASRGRLVSQALVEMLLLGVLGGALGLVFAYWAVQGLVAVAPVNVPRIHDVHLNGRAEWFTLAISLLTGILAGVLPAWRAASVNPQEALWSGGARSGDSRARLRARGFLVGLETALSAVLLIAAGLLITSFSNLLTVPTGFGVEHVLTLTLQLPRTQYPQRQQRQQFWSEVLRATAALPGVESSAVTDWLPLSGERNDDPVNLPGDTRPPAERPFASYRHVSPDYFRAFGIPLVRGRELTPSDADTSSVVVSEAAATTIWPGRDPIGQRSDIDPASGFPGFQVVGIVGDTRTVSLSKSPTPVVYELYTSGVGASLVLRSRVGAPTVAPELRDAIWHIDRSMAIPQVVSMSDRLSDSVASQRFEALLTSLFAAAALMLAALGIYGVVSYAVVR
ncbi:MAG: ADOP family duplicated permease, partial [Vicinamibacterales bacterium]